ncbi:MAG TPA: alpha/beta hydrolase [Chitinophagaceae bacterium]|nr:alpha/beta hydrolase [Chitinophagaceae bacterium]
MYRILRNAVLLLLTFCLAASLHAQTAPARVPYGNNPAAGHYLQVGDARIYYEVYGKGQPFVLLHGGVYGYIDEFEPFIPRLAEQYQVICIATRGHGKSGAGSAPFTYRQRAEDAYAVIRSLTKDSVTVLGFSDGGYSAMKLAALHPETVKKLIVIGAGDFAPNNNRQKAAYTREDLLKNSGGFFQQRLALMPEPDQWNDILSRLNKLYNEDFMSTETFSLIRCPTLVLSGDRDDYQPVESVLRCARAIPQSRLSIIPGCSHVVFYCNFPAVWEAMRPFLALKP